MQKFSSKHHATHVISIFQIYLVLLYCAGFSNVIGAIDGSLIMIHKFKTNIKDYISHRNKPEINVMVR